MRLLILLLDEIPVSWVCLYECVCVALLMLQTAHTQKPYIRHPWHVVFVRRRKFALYTYEEHTHTHVSYMLLHILCACSLFICLLCKVIGKTFSYTCLLGEPKTHRMVSSSSSARFCIYSQQMNIRQLMRLVVAAWKTWRKALVV